MVIEEATAVLINPYSDVMSDQQYMIHQVKHIESVARTCYKSEAKITDTSYIQFVSNLIARGHEAMLEHSGFSVRFVVDRGVSHELVRHRMASFAQESTRYCRYSDGVAFIRPLFFEDGSIEMDNWIDACMVSENKYLQMLDAGVSPQQARTVLPNSLKTEVIMSANFREWRHFFKLRACGTTGKPHPQMAQVTQPLLVHLRAICPVIFDDLILT